MLSARGTVWSADLSIHPRGALTAPVALWPLMKPVRLDQAQ